MDFPIDFQAIQDKLTEMPTLTQIENIRLHHTLRLLKERELYILFAKVIDDRSFEELANELGIGYKAVTSIYYRMMEKIKKALEVTPHEF